MKTVEHCLPCTITQDRIFFNKFLPELPLEGRKKHFEWIASMFEVGMPTVELGIKQNERRQELLEVAGKDRDAFKEIKYRSHELVKKLIKYKPHTLEEKIMFAIAGNRIDYGREEYPSEEHLIGDIQRIVTEKSLMINDVPKFYEALRKARSVMYILDNAGEDIFDLPLIEHCSIMVGKDNTFIVGRDEPIVNDVTVNELYEYGFDKYGQILSVGGFQHGVMMNKVSDTFKKTFEAVDLIIPKGLGCYESLTEYREEPGEGKRYHILIAKCPVVADSLNVPRWSNVVLSSNRYARGCKEICLHDSSECVHRTKVYG